MTRANGFHRWAALLVLLATAASVPADELRFGTSVAVSPADGRAIAPDVAVGPDGSVHLLWVDKAPVELSEEDKALGHTHTAADQLWYRRADANGVLKPAVRVNRTDGEVWGFGVSKPELDVDARGTIHVHFPGNAVNDDTKKGLLVARYARSTDGGATFEPARTLNSPAQNDLSAIMHGGFAAAAAFGTLLVAGDEVRAFWIDTRDMTEESTAGGAWQAISRDGGKTFQTDTAAYTKDICPCCQLAAAESQGRVLLTSRTTYDGGFRDSAIGASPLGKDDFNTRTRVGEGRWEIAGCPLKRTAIAAVGNTVYTATFTGGRDPAGAYLSRSNDGGNTFSPAELIHAGAAVSDAPTLAIDRDGRLFVAWHAKTGGNRRVFVRASAPNGGALGPVTELPAPPGVAQYPELDAAPNGGAWLAWQQDQVAMVVRLQ
jgi:hypothetical protein